MTIPKRMEPKIFAIFLLGVSWLVYAAFFASTGFFSGDEVIYATTIDRFAKAGSFVIENGYSLVPATALKFVLLVEGKDGLVMQYPVGFAVIAAPFYLLGGLQGVVFLSALTSAMSMLLTYKITNKLFDDKSLATTAALLFGLATYAVDYAFSFWPHATANFFVAAGIYAAVLSIMNKNRNWQWAALAGLVLGLGVAIRADVIIAAPILFIWMFVNARQPLRMVGFFVLFLGLGLGVAAWLNFLKFGVFNPLSYGRSSGGTSLSFYLGYIPYAVLAGLLIMSLRWQHIRAWVSGKRSWFLLGVAITISLAVPAIRDVVLSVLVGLYVLLIDLESHKTIGSSPFFTQVDGDYYIFYGILKKSLVQSLPYLGLALFAAVKLFKRQNSAAYALCLLMPLAWFLPFTPTQWVGGLASNLRYFTPVLPLLAILGALAWRDITSPGAGKLWLKLSIAVILSLALMFAWASQSQTLGSAEAFTIIGGSQLLAILIAVFSVIWLALPAIRNRMQSSFTVLVQMGFIFALISAYAGDLNVNHERRSMAALRSEALSYVEENAHVVGDPLESFWFQLIRPKATLASFPGVVRTEDIDYINAALDQGRPVYIWSTWVVRQYKSAMLQEGYNFGPSGYSIVRSVSPVDGQHYGLYRVSKNE